MKLSESLFILDEKDSRYSEVCLQLLALGGQHSLLPELLDIFGKKEVMKLLDVFAGVEFVIPSRERLTSTVRNSEIYLSLKEETSTREYLAKKHGLGETQVNMIYEDTKAVLERHGFVLKDKEKKNGERRRKSA